MYKQVGTYIGDVKLLASKLDSFELDKSSSGYGSTSDRPERVRETFYPFVSDLFPGNWSYSMLVSLDPGGSLPPHRDAPLIQGIKRFHLILQSNEYTWTMHDFEWQQLEVGNIYTMNPNCLHASINWGHCSRIHLVVDCEGYCGS